MAIVFHITTREAFRQEAVSYSPERFQTEGYIHCSTPDQVVKVADARFRGQTGLVLLCIETDKVEAEIRYENLEGGQELFPHIYGELNTDAVVQIADFAPGADGYFTLPAVAQTNSLRN